MSRLAKAIADDAGELPLPTQGDTMTTEYPPVDAPPAETPTTVAADLPPDGPPDLDIAAKEVPPGARRRDRVLGTVGQVAGVIGLVACLALVLGVVFARGWAVGTVDDVSEAAVTQIAKVEPLVGQASARFGEISGRVSTVADIAASVAANPNPAPGVAEGLRAGLAGVLDRYQDLRSGYGDVREAVVSLTDRLATLERLVPGFSIPQGPIDALSALDARVREFDSSVTGLIAFDPGQGPLRTAAATIAERAGEIDARIEQLQAGLENVEQRISMLSTRIVDAASSIKTAITIGSIAVVLMLLYFAFLHWVLFRHSGEIRRKQPAG